MDGTLSSRTIGEVHNGNLCRSLSNHVQDAFYLLHRVS